MIGRRLRTMLDPDAGMSLPELIVVMMITSLVLTMIGGFFVSISNDVNAGNSSRQATGSLTPAIDEVTRVVRSATTNQVTDSTTAPAIVAAISTGTAMSVITLADTDANTPVPALVAFSVNTKGDLVELRTAAVLVSGRWQFTGLTTKRVFPGPFDTLAPLFVYRDATGAAVTPGTDALAAAVTSVDISLTIARRGLAGDDPVTLSTNALMPNVTL